MKMDMDMDMGMKMYFHYSIEETVLFKSWKTTNYSEFFGTIFILIFLGIIYEFIKNYRYSLQDCKACVTNDQDTFGFLRYIFKKDHLVDTLLFTIQLILSYVLMLVVMTYNAWFLKAILIGAFIGHLIFGQMASKPNTNQESHCGP